MLRKGAVFRETKVPLESRGSVDRRKTEPKDFFPLVSINAAGKTHRVVRLAPPLKITFSIQVASFEFHHPESQKLNFFFFLSTSYMRIITFLFAVIA